MNETLSIDAHSPVATFSGTWLPDESAPRTDSAAMADALARWDRPVYVVDFDGAIGVAQDGAAQLGNVAAGERRAGHRLMALVPALRPEQLGDPEFRETHRVRFAYVAGEMANGIGSAEMVEAMARAGMLGFFGAAGLPIERVDAAIERIRNTVGDRTFGFNLIHSPSEPDLEAAVADLYLRRGVRLVSASAYLDLTLPLVRYRVSGIRRERDGAVVAPNRVMAKVSRVEVARKFLSPPPAKFLEALVQRGDITAEQARWAECIPMADDLTAEADSGGHTDNRPLVALLPTMIALRDELQARFCFARPVRIGAAGGISTPASAAAAFAMGAAYVMTGSVNQSCVEAGTSAAVKEMLAKAGQADVIMAPAADMFEMGVKVQVLKWGTMFAVRGQKLYELYRAFERLEDVPPAQRSMLEKDYFRCSLEEAWASTRAFFERRDPRQIERADRDPKHKMALVFRAYLGQASKWAIQGEPSRRPDYQVWCGPAMGAFNEWVRGTVLERPEQRGVVTVALNIMAGAAVGLRAAWLRSQGVHVPPDAARFAPRSPEELGLSLAASD